HLFSPRLSCDPTQRQLRGVVDLDDGPAGGVGEGRPGHRVVVQRQDLAALDRHPAIVQLGAADLAVAADIDAAGAAGGAVIDGAAIDGDAAQRQRRGVVDLDDGAAGGVGEGRPGHRVVVERQDLAALDRYPAVVQLGAADLAVAADVDAAGAAGGAVIDGAAIDGDATQRQRGGVVDLDDGPAGGVGEGRPGHRVIVERQDLAAPDRPPAIVQLGPADLAVAADVDAAGAAGG